MQTESIEDECRKSPIDRKQKMPSKKTQKFFEAKSLAFYVFICYNRYVKYEIELDGRFEVDINYWNGKASLTYEGIELPRGEGKNTFLLGNEKCVIGGTLFSGVYLCRGEKKALISKLYWYDYIAGILPFVVGLLGNYIGAVLGAIAFFLIYKIMPYVKNYVLRLLICVAFAAVVFAIVLFLAGLFPSLFGIGGGNGSVAN